MSLGSARYGRGSADKAVTKIVAAVAEENGVEPADLPPLYDTIDPDHLVSFVKVADQTASASFQYCGLTVSVSGDGNVRLRRPPDDE